MAIVATAEAEAAAMASLKLFPLPSTSSSSSSSMLLLPLFPLSPDLPHLHPPKRRRLLLPSSFPLPSPPLDPPDPPPSSSSSSPPLLRSLLLSRFSPTPSPDDAAAAAALVQLRDRKLRILFEKQLTDSDVSPGQDRLLLGKRSQGCLGTDNTPSAPEWRDVALIFHDVEESGRTWLLLHGFWPSSRAFVLKGRQWSKLRDHKRLQAKDILTISVDDADGSLWISHRPTALRIPHVQESQQQEELLSSPSETLNLFPLAPDLKSRPPLRHRRPSPPPIFFKPRPKSSPVSPTPRTPLTSLDLNLGLQPATSSHPTPAADCQPVKKQRISTSPSPSSPAALPSSSTSSASLDTSSECSSTCIINGSTSEDRMDGSPESQVDQEAVSTLLTLGHRSPSGCQRGERPKAVVSNKLRVLFEKQLTDSDVSPGQDRLLLGKRSRGCLGQGNTPSAPEWRDVALILHDEEEGKTWKLLHGFWPSSRAFVLKGREWSQYRAQKRLQAKDMIVISVDEADGSLWISHRRSQPEMTLQ